LADILLFNQYYTANAESPEYVLAPIPLNLLYLATYLKTKGLDCRVFELGVFSYDDVFVEESGKIRCGKTDEEILKIIENEKPEIIGLGCVYTMHFWDVLAIARLIKKFYPGVTIVLGGNHATVFADEILKEKSFDFVVRGEGEATFHELCDNLLNKKPGIENIHGISYRNDNGNITRNPDRKLIHSLDELPMPDYSLIEVKKYSKPAQKSPYVMRYPLLGMMTSRGCPGKCIFCTVKSVWGRTWRPRSAKNTVDEIETLVKNYGIREISFLDDSVSVGRERWREICNEIIKRKLDIKWTTPNGIAFWTLDDEILDLMKKAGCYRITFGIESGNEETKKFIGKEYPLSQAKSLIKHANKIGMWTICTNILGFPYETREQIQDTVDFAKHSGTDFAAFYPLSPHLTSDVYAFFKKEGLLNYDTVFTDNWLEDKKYEEMFKALYLGGFTTKYLTSGELREIQLKAYRSFIIYRGLSYLLNPLIILRKIRSTEDFKYVLKLLYTGMMMFLRNFISLENFRKKSVYNIFYKHPKKITNKR
jgi:magnesium-protoporphyrin IX monomethyl ester (oxidative) cyclase